MIDTTDANAVLDALQWLTGDPGRGYRTPVTDTEAADALRHLATRSAELLAHTNPAEEATALVDQLLATRAATTTQLELARAAVVEAHTRMQNLGVPVDPLWASYHDRNDVAVYVDELQRQQEAEPV